MDLIDCIHQDNEAGAKECLARTSELLNQADAVGNTPLHYAVAQRNLKLIRFMMTKQRADITARNCNGETAADWLQEYIDSIRQFKEPNKVEELKQQVIEGNVELIIEGLRVRLSRKLRFSQGETLLHVAIQAEQEAIVKAILEGISHERVQQLLGLKNSRGITPLQLAQDLGKPASGEGELQRILYYLQEKQQATTPLSHPPPLLRPFNADLITKAVTDLTAALTHPLTPPDFVELAPLRSALCYLAYNTCYRALHHLSTLSTQDNNGFNKLRLKELLKNLLGRSDEHTCLELEKKIRAITYSLGALIQQQQVEQVIHLSNKLAVACGWTVYHENKIYLDPTKVPNVVGLVKTLIHELSHQNVYSYDFVYLVTDFEEGYSIEVSNAYQLAFRGEVYRSIPGKEALFEIFHQLRVGSGGNWRKSLYQWKAMNTADIHAAAILGLATLPGGQASFENRFLSIESCDHFLRSIQDCQTLSDLPLTKTPSSSDSSEWSTMSSSGSPSPPLSLLGEQIAAHTSSEAIAIQPAPSRAAATEEMTREGPGLLCCLGKQ